MACDFEYVGIFNVPLNGVIRTTLHFQFYFELKESFEKIKLPQLLATNCGTIKKYLHRNRTYII
jgi:hypothetical protein